MSLAAPTSSATGVRPIEGQDTERSGASTAVLAISGLRIAFGGLHNGRKWRQYTVTLYVVLRSSKTAELAGAVRS